MTKTAENFYQNSTTLSVTGGSFGALVLLVWPILALGFWDLYLNRAVFGFYMCRGFLIWSPFSRVMGISLKIPILSGSPRS